MTTSTDFNMNLLLPLFSPATGTWGGLTRSLAVAEAAKDAGHRVAFCASGYLERTLRERGFQVYAMPPTTMLGLPKSISRLLERRSQRAAIPVKPGTSIGNIWMVLLISGFARSGFLRQLTQAEMDAAEDFGADHIFTDLDPGAYLMAHLTGMPIASAYASIVEHGHGTLPWRVFRRAANQTLAAFESPPTNPDDLCFGPSVLKIIPSVPDLDETDPDRSDARYVGHLISPIQPEAEMELELEPGQRAVFVYVGTGSISLDRLESVLPVLFPIEGDRRCFVGVQTIEASYRIEGVHFHPYVPADVLLPFCDWTICHGGQNTIIQSLLNDVPLLIFPGPIFERRYNARKVQEAGGGLWGEVDQFTVEWLESAMARREEILPGTAALGARLRSYGGPQAAVEAIEGWGQA
jgi:UDP:flavonoid glycosyltransferase YjiC (YdhE family)